MPDYRFRAVNPQGKILQGAMAATDETHLTGQLTHLGYELLTSRAVKPRIGWYRAAPDSKQLMLLLTQLAALTEAGVPLATCLTDTAQSLPDSLLRDTLRDILQQVQRGVDFIAACGKHPRIFPRSILAVLQAGAASGNLALGFAKARDHAQWQMEFGALLRRATRYPLFLLVLAVAVISFMMLFVVPQLVVFLQAQDYALPWHSRALIWIAEQFNWLWWSLPLLIIASGATLIGLRRQLVSFVHWSDAALLRLPLFGALIRQRELAHFLHHLSLLVGGGVPILSALTTASSILHNHALQEQARQMIAAVTSGHDLAGAWQNSPLCSGIIARRAQIGLQTGTLAEQLAIASTECDSETIARSKQLIGALEPTLTLLVGLMLAWIVLAVLGPLYGALNTLGVSR